jgi:hypothetical protein
MSSMLEIKAAHHGHTTGDGIVMKGCAVLAEHGVARVEPILLRHSVYPLQDEYGMASSLSNK